jgi:predicted PurR-regulated permease PerM
MTLPGQSWNIAATLVVLFVAALVLLFLGQVSEVAILLFIAALMGVYLTTVTDALVRWTHMPRWIALTIAIVGSLAAAAGIGALVLPTVVLQVQELVSRLPRYAQDFDALLAQLAERYPVLQGTALGSEGGGLVQIMIDDTSEFVRGSLLPYLTAGGKVAVELVSVFAMAIYMARSPAMYREGVLSLVPPKYRHLARTVMTDLRDTMRTWIWAQLFAMLVLAVLTGVGLWLLQVPYALAFGVFTGAVAIVPFFGTIVSTILPALLMFTISTGWHAFAVLGLGVVVHLIEANVVAPIIFQERVSLPPVLTILSVLVMATVLGVFGLLVAVPTLAAVIVLVRHILFGQVYAEQDTRTVSSAVLVAATGERKAIVFPD